MSEKLKISPITSGYRPIKDGKQYEQFFGIAEDRDRVIIQDGDVDDTVNLMKKVVWKYIGDTKKLAEYLKAGSVKDTCRNIWDFLYNHIQYKLDEKGLEQLRRPARSWQDRKEGIDCDCFSVFVSSILTNLKISHCFRITKYEQDNFQHVYVIVPKETGGHHTIDCVLSRFDYEKPFTAKKDFNMSLNGINVAVLSGAAGRNVMDLVNDLEGLENLGADSNQERLDAMYHHLVQTRRMITEKPEMISTVEYPPAFIKMLDYAIENWNTPNRDKALEILAKNEEALNKHYGLSGVDEDDDTDDDWSHLDGLTDDEIIEQLGGKSKAEKKEAKKAKKEEKKAKKAEEEKAGGDKPKKGFFSKMKEAMKKGGKAFIRFNPVTIAARGGFLLAVKLNVKKMASKLKPAYMTLEEAKAAGYTEDQWNKAKVAIVKIEKTFVDKLQGKRDKLKSAIMKARVKKLNGLAGEDEEFDLGRLGAAPAAAAILAAAIPVIATCVKALKGSGLMNKGESEDITAELKAGEAEANSMMNDDEMKDNGEEGSEGNRSSEDGSADGAPTGFMGKIIDFAKKNPLVVAAGAGLVIWGATKIFKKKKEQPKQLSGTLEGTAPKKRKSPAKKAKRKASVERILLK